MDTSSIVVAVIALLVLGFILFTYLYSPDWFVEVAPAPEPLKPSAKVVTVRSEPFTNKGNVGDIFNLNRP